MPNGERHYWIITTALVRAERQVDEFVFNGDRLLRWDGISPNFFVPNALGLDIAALSGIKRLHLLPASCRDAGAPEYCGSVGGLPQLIGSMHLLERLEPDLPNTINDLILYNHDQVFPKVTMWTSLGTLGLFDFSRSATSLLRLLLIQMPRLKNLDLSPTQLVEGCWESVIECLKQCNQFTTVKIESDCLLYHRGEEFLLCDNADISEYCNARWSPPLPLRGPADVCIRGLHAPNRCCLTRPRAGNEKLTHQRPNMSLLTHLLAFADYFRLITLPFREQYNHPENAFTQERHLASIYPLDCTATSHVRYLNPTQ